MKNIFVSGAIPAEKVSESISRHAVKKEIGAHSLFVGQVRADVKGDAKVEAIEFTAHEPLALKVAHQIREELIERYELTCAHIYHSLGRVEVGELCFFVFTSSPHRSNAMKACEETVERFKAEVPLWGKEILTNKDYLWKENQPLIK